MTHQVSGTSGNEYGIQVEHSDYNFIAGNVIGMRADGLSPLYNSEIGINIKAKTFHNAVCSNFISGNVFN